MIILELLYCQRYDTINNNIIFICKHPSEVNVNSYHCSAVIEKGYILASIKIKHYPVF